MKKKILVLTIICASAFQLIGCSKVGSIIDKDTDISQEQVVESEKTPEKIVENFAKAIFNGENQKALDMIYMPEGAIKDLKAFEKYLVKLDLEPVEMKKVTAKAVDDSNDDLRGIKVTATTKDGKTVEVSFHAMINEDNEWNVSPRGMVTENWEINVPKGAKVTLNGKELSITPEKKEEKSDEKNNPIYDSYKIPMIFEGSYDLTVEHPLAKTSKEEKVFTGNAKTVKLVLNDEALEKAEEGLNKLLNTISEKASSNVDFGELTGVVVSEKSKSLTSMQEAYNELKEKLTTDYKKYNYNNYKDLNHSNLTIKEAYYNGDNTIYLEGSYENLYKERYAGSVERLHNATFSSISKKLDFKITFEVDENGNYLQINGERIFSRID